MKNNALEENLSSLNETIRNYLDARIKLLKLLLVEKITRTGTYFFSVVVGIVIIASLLLLLTFAFSFWYGYAYGSIYGGFLISAGFYIIVGILVFLLRRSIFSNNVVRNLSNILFSDDPENETKEK